MPEGLTISGLGALITAVALLPLLHFERNGAVAPRLFFKPIASLGFLITAWGAGALDSAAGTAIFVGLALSMLGDVLLIFTDQRAFLAGLVAFLAGHVAYAVAFVMIGVDPLWAGVTAVLIMGLGLLFLRELWPKLPAEMRRPVAAYIVVITVMVVCALGAFGTGLTSLLIPIGALTFYLSDISVALDRFDGAGYGNRLLGLPLYYGAQTLLALSVAGLS